MSLYLATKMALDNEDADVPGKDLGRQNLQLEATHTSGLLIWPRNRENLSANY